MNTAKAYGPGGGAPRIAVVGAGILGLWQALLLARAGFPVTLLDAALEPFANAASRYAGAMVAPHCEAEAAPALVRDQGLAAARLWFEHYPGLQHAGTLVVAGSRDRLEIDRFARMTSAHERLDGDGIGALEPDLAGRFTAGLFYADEAHMTTPDALAFLLDAARAAGAQSRFGQTWSGDPAELAVDVVVDTRGLGARADIATLRAVRGERIVVRTRDVRLTRPVRLLHPRQPLYVVPWTGARYLIGATVLESEDATALTVRSALELLGLAYALHPGFGEAEILDMGAGLRPSLPDNVPRVLLGPDPRVIRVNGAYRHGFLLAPALAGAVVGWLARGERGHPLITEPRGPE